MQKFARTLVTVGILALALVSGACSGEKFIGPSPTPTPNPGGPDPVRISSIELKTAAPESGTTVRVTKVNPVTREILSGSGAVAVRVKWSISDEKIAEAKATNQDILVSACLWTKTQNGEPIEVFGGCAGKGAPLTALTGETDLALMVWETTPWIKQTDHIVVKLNLWPKGGSDVPVGEFATQTIEKAYNWDFDWK